VRKGTIITLGASAAFGVLAIVLARGFINTAVNTQYEQVRDEKARKIAKTAVLVKMKTVPVMVADMRLMPGEPLTEQSVNIVEFPENSVPEGSYTSYEMLFLEPNNPSVVLTQMAQGEPILAFKISAPGGRASLSAQLGDNMRAVSIRVNDVSGVAGFVSPEDTVDVILTREIEATKIGRYGKNVKGGDRKASFIAEILLQNIKVLGTDQTTNMGSDGPKLAKTITLEVNAMQAQKLALAKSVGTLTLALRAVGTSETFTASALRVGDLTGKKTRPRRSVRTKKARPVNQTAQVVVVRDGQPRLVKVYRDEAKKQDMASLQNPAGQNLAGQNLAGGTQ